MSWRKAAADCGFEITRDFYQNLVGRSRADALQRTLDEFGDVIPMPKFGELVRHYEKTCFEEEPIVVKAGAWEMIAAVDAAGLKKAVATSTHRVNAAPRLVRTGLGERFETVVCGDEVVNPKPAPDLYLAACRALNVDPKDILAFEDSEPGIQAAAAAGVTVIAVPDFKPPAPEIAELAWRVLPSLVAAREFLAG
jgi:HAD superfamily hydrolase (TIGR01509 family)